ncbi:MAG: response regulator, partial [Deltaproteobacteria bacterium]|nr:response regulator [Deltaproteobacteria bacterium]
MHKILVIDDDQGILNFLEVFLMQTGKYQPVCLNDSTRAIDVISDFKPDLILLDMDMPEV